MVNKQAYSVTMNLDVPDSEKRIAQEAVNHFQKLLYTLKDFTGYLDIIYTPFNKRKGSSFDMEMIEKYRKTFREYIDQVEKKFNNIVDMSKHNVSIMSAFNADTATEEMMNSFESAIRELKKYVDIFISLFSNLNNQDFGNNLVSTIDAIKKQVNQIKQLLNDRILEHIDSNILAKNWAQNISDDDSAPVQDKIPLVIELFRERQKALQNK